MENKNLIYRLGPRKNKNNKLVMPNKKNDESQLSMKPVNFFENCYIFSEPSIYSRFETI
jgi:hypothetical protein